MTTGEKTLLDEIAKSQLVILYKFLFGLKGYSKCSEKCF